MGFPRESGADSRRVGNFWNVGTSMSNENGISVTSIRQEHKRRRNRLRHTNYPQETLGRETPKESVEVFGVELPPTPEYTWRTNSRPTSAGRRDDDDVFGEENSRRVPPPVGRRQRESRRSQKTIFTDDTERASSLASWEEDDFDREAARRLAEQFAELDRCLYEGAAHWDPVMEQECRDWAAKFPHLRVVGSRISPVGQTADAGTSSTTLCHSALQRSTLTARSRPAAAAEQVDSGRNKQSDSRASALVRTEEIIAIDRSPYRGRGDGEEAERLLARRSRFKSDLLKRLAQTAVKQVLEKIFTEKSMIKVQQPTDTKTPASRVRSFGVDSSLTVQPTATAKKRYSDPNPRVTTPSQVSLSGTLNSSCQGRRRQVNWTRDSYRSPTEPKSANGGGAVMERLLPAKAKDEANFDANRCSATPKLPPIERQPRRSYERPTISTSNRVKLNAATSSSPQRRRRQPITTKSASNSAVHKGKAKSTNRRSAPAAAQRH